MSQTQNPETIPFVDLVAQYHRYQSELDAAMAQSIRRKLGVVHRRARRNAALREGLRRTTAARRYCDRRRQRDGRASTLVLRTLGVGAGDEVDRPGEHVHRDGRGGDADAGAKVVFVDVREEDALLDPTKLEAAITPRTKVILPVHLYGQLADMKAILAIAEKHGVVVVEDSAQAHGAEEHGKRAGSFGRATGFSFYPGKNLGAYGDGGGVVTNDAVLADKVRRLANHGRAEKFGHEIPGVNSRLDGLQGAILEVKLRHLDTWANERRAAAKRYTAMLADVPGVKGFEVRSEKAHVFHLYVVRVADREGLKTHLASRNIQSGIHYPQALHLLPAYADLGYAKGSFPIAERLAGEILSLPIFPEITEAQQRRVVDAVREWQTKGGAR
jgi:dTDP-4-amino-4,6-dideoxygalactose transaminase